MNHRGESMEEDDMVMSRVGNTPSTERRTDGGGRAASPKWSYKEVPRPSRGLALAAAKRTLTVALRRGIKYSYYIKILRVDN